MDVFEEFLECILHLKEVFDSDGNFLIPFLSSILNSSSVHISVPDNLHKRLLVILLNFLEFCFCFWYLLLIISLWERYYKL
jgi:hypothetical protein